MGDCCLEHSLPALRGRSPTRGMHSMGNDAVLHVWDWIKEVPGASLVARMGKNPPASAGDLGSVPGLGIPPGGGHGNPVRYPCLENPMDRGAWRATVHGVLKSQTRHNRLNSNTMWMFGRQKASKLAETPNPVFPSEPYNTPHQLTHIYSPVHYGAWVTTTGIFQCHKSRWRQLWKWRDVADCR